NKLLRALNMNMEDNGENDVLDALVENVFHDLGTFRVSEDNDYENDNEQQQIEQRDGRELGED
ncbi:unnamed protein product, partial [Didymodactylos carnosus]